MYRFLLTRRWISGLALAVVAAIVCLLLSSWQWHRREERLARNHVVTSNYDRTPVPLSQVVRPGDADLDFARSWTPVEVRGRYLTEATILVRNRPFDGTPGYRVLVPLRADDGTVLLVDRGWVQIGATADQPDAVPAPPSGEVRVVSRLRVPEPVSDKQAPPGQTQSITPSALTGQLSTHGIQPAHVVTATYGILASEDPAPAGSLQPFPKPELDEGPHLSYSMQWVVFAVMFVGGWVLLVRRQAEDDAWEAEHSGQPAPPRRNRLGSGGTADEDAEDAQLDTLDSLDTPSGRPGG